MLVRRSIWVVSALLSALSIGQYGWCADQGGFGSQENDPWANFDDKPLFPDPLFPEPLFSKDSMKTRLSNDMTAMQTPAKTPGVDSSAAVMNAKISDSQVDDEMRRQMRAVAQYLYRYCLRNGSRFPGPEGGYDIMWAAQAQLTELVPNNPYAYGTTETINWGVSSQYNANGSPATGSPVWNDQYQEGLVANQQGRVLLQYDYGLNPTIANDDAHHPPSDWTAAPGIITCIGNNQGFFIVWGADRNGKPIRNPMNGLTYLVSVSTSGTVQDQNAPNGI